MKRLGELSDQIDAKVYGDAQAKITGAASIKQATPGDITFAVNRKHFDQFVASQATAAVISTDIEFEQSELAENSVLVVDDAER